MYYAIFKTSLSPVNSLSLPLVLVGGEKKLLLIIVKGKSQEGHVTIVFD